MILFERAAVCSIVACKHAQIHAHVIDFQLGEFQAPGRVKGRIYILSKSAVMGEVDRLLIQRL